MTPVEKLVDILGVEGSCSGADLQVLSGLGDGFASAIEEALREGRVFRDCRGWFATCDTPTASAPRTVSSVDFGGLTITYDADMLRPRAWTISQAEWAAGLLPGLPAGPVLELCAGAGHIGLLAVRQSRRPLVSVERDPGASLHIRRNAAAAGLGGATDVRTASVAQALAEDEVFPLIIADPPWVETLRTPEYPADPVAAIDGGADGLAVARACLAAMRAHLADGGAGLLQLGATSQAQTIITELGQDPDERLEVTETRVCDGGVVILIRPRRSLRTK